MAKSHLCFLLALMCVFLPAQGFAGIATYSGIDPAAEMTGTAALPEGGDQFSFSTSSADGNYKITFTVTEEPALVAVTGGSVTLYDYQAATGTLDIYFAHTGYADGTSDSTFKVSIIAAGQGGMPATVHGAYMSSNVLPWKLVAPAAADPSFGFQVTGPAAAQGNLFFYFPNSLLELLSQLHGEQLTAGDLALFNGPYQVSLEDVQEVRANLVPIGAWASADFRFDSAAFELIQIEAASVVKKLTVRKRRDVSLAPSKSLVRPNEKVKLFGWVKGGTSGESVQITSNVASGSPRRLRLNSEGYFSVNIKTAKTAVIQAIYKPRGSKAKRSNKVRVSVK